jgi:hypothetical protein
MPLGCLHDDMADQPLTTDIDAELVEAVTSAARTSLGDTLRSVVYFTPSSFDVLYVRQDLYESPAAATEAKGPLVDMERVGFAEAPVRSALPSESPSSIGAYEFTVRFHSDGFVVRILEQDVGVLLTVDSMDVAAFEDATSAISKLLRES